MAIKTSSKLSLTVLMLCTLLYSAEAKPRNYTSPNGCYTVNTVYREGENPVFSIKDNRSGRVDESIEFTFPRLWFRWGADSTTFMSVEHIAGGTIERVIFHLHGKWVSHVLEEPSEEMHNCAIVGATIGSKKIHMAIKFAWEDERGLQDDLGKCQFDFDSATGKCFNIMTRRISVKQFEAMKVLSEDSK